ncbi:MAG: F0F1 ATP synthase subunit delta [bacterium]|nr:F0F1 ATP synthase subunit delta [bacterium]
MKITPIKYAKSLLEALDGAPKEKREAYLDNFLKIIERNNDGKNLSDIFKEIEKIEHEKSGVKNVTITTAVALSDKTVEEISKKLEKIFSSKIEMQREVNLSIGGGIMIESGEDYFDKSLQSYINKFKHLIIN